MREFTIRSLHPRDLTRRQRLLVVYVFGLVAVVVTYTVLYFWGMRALEGRPRSIFQAFNTVIETMTTTGYGADSPWTTPLMNLFVVTVQVTGVVIGFVTLRVLVIPLFERTPLNLDDRLSVKDEHVVLAEYQRDTGVLLDELAELGVDYVLIESDEEEAKRLSDEGYQVINGDPETRADLNRASIERASLLITDAGDRTASVVLTALETNEELRVISFTASTRRSAALAEVGVNRSVSPHALVGRRLAEKATTPVAVETALDSGSGSESEATDTADDEPVVVREVLVRRESPLDGVRVGDSPVAADPNLTLVAGWFDGELRISPSPDVRLTPNAVLVVAGPASAIDALASEVSGVRTRRPGSPSRVVVAGLGDGGRAAVEGLPDDVPVTTIDESDAREPDVVGDATEPETLSAARLDEASALIVTVDDDATALLTVAMARAVAADLEVLVRVTDTEKASPAFRAGADFVLSIQRVCARLVAAEVYGEHVVDPVSQIRLVRTDAEPFVGETLAATRRDGDRGWTVVGLARGGRVLTDQATTVEADDDVFVAGSDDAIRAFERDRVG